MKPCTNCGISLDNDKGFCPNCGHPVDVSSSATVQSRTTNNPYAANTYSNQPPIPIPPPPPHLSPRKGSGAVRIIIVAVIVILVILGGILGALLLGHHKVATQTVATQTPTKTATVASTQITVNPYTNTGKLVLNDPLKDNGLGYGWDVVTDQLGKCAFTGGAYHVSTLSATSGWTCSANPDFSNFAFEVQMTILKGDQGGIIFRSSSVYDYRFDVVQDGSYELIAERGTASNQGVTTVYKFKTLINLVSSPAIHQGLGQTNSIAVVAQGSLITLYVNSQQIASVTDNNFSHGNIGLVAAANATGGHPTEVAYSNAKVWTL